MTGKANILGLHLPKWQNINSQPAGENHYLLEGGGHSRGLNEILDIAGRGTKNQADG